MELRHKINLKVEIRGPYAVNVQGINPKTPITMRYEIGKKKSEINIQNLLVEIS